MGIEYKLRSLIKLHIQPGIPLVQTTTYSVRHLLVTLVEYMRELAAKNLTELANNWLSQDEENPRAPETDPITEEEPVSYTHLAALCLLCGGLPYGVWAEF